MAIQPQNPPPISSPAWSARTKRLIALLAFLFVALALWRVNSALPILIVALLLAYLLYPLTTFLERRIFARFPGKRAWAILITLVLFISVFALLIGIVVPVVFGQVRELAERLPTLAANLQADVEAALSQPLTFNNQPILINGEPLIPLEQIQQAAGADTPGEEAQSTIDLVQLGRSFVSSLTGPAFNFVGGAFNLVINLILLLTLIFYLLKDGGKFVTGIVGLASPMYRNDVRRLLYELAQVWNGYLRGQLILSTFVGFVVLAAALILGVPNAPILALISAVLEFMPNIGPLIALIPAALLALSSTSSTLPFLSGVPFALVVILVWTLIQNMQAVIVTPRVMGDNLDLHPIAVVFGVLAGASLAGPLGVILAAPTLASLRVLGQYIYGKLTDTPPFERPSHLKPGQVTLRKHQRVMSARRWLREHVGGRVVE